MKKKILIILIILVFFNFSALWPGEKNKYTYKQTVFLLPFQQLTMNNDYEWLADNIFSAFEIHFKKQATIELLTGKKNLYQEIGEETEDILEAVKTTYNAQTCIMGEYYVAQGILYIMVRVIDMLSFRDKNCFVESMPADLDIASQYKQNE